MLFKFVNIVLELYVPFIPRTGPVFPPRPLPPGHSAKFMLEKGERCLVRMAKPLFSSSASEGKTRRGNRGKAEEEIGIMRGERGRGFQRAFYFFAAAGGD